MFKLNLRSNGSDFRLLEMTKDIYLSMGHKSGDRGGHGNNLISSSSRKPKKLEQYVNVRCFEKCLLLCCLHKVQQCALRLL
jgi:hypothetical protein